MADTGGSPQQSFTIDIKNIILHKFDTLISDGAADRVNSLDITPQLGEITFYQSIFSPVMKGEISVTDQIGLFVNFPLTGDEVVSITYEQQDVIDTKYFVIESVHHITPDNTLRTVQYVINILSFEAYFGARTRVSHSYSDTPDKIVSSIMDEYINKEIVKLYPTYKIKTIEYSGTDNLISRTMVVPNVAPFKAITWVNREAVSSDPKLYAYVFYENFSGFQFRPLQFVFQDQGFKAKADKQKYQFISNEIPTSTMKNKGRLITNLQFNRRLSSFGKITAGYFQNTLFEINMAQKAYWMKEVTNHDLTTIAPNTLNRSVYEQFTQVNNGTEEDANKVRYVINNYRENDEAYTNPEYRDKWGKVISGTSALSQVDLTVVVPGNVTLEAGDLFHLTLPEMHGFNKNKPDDLITGYFFISEVKHIMMIGGRHSTTLRLNKDSYESSVDRPSRYGSK